MAESKPEWSLQDCISLRQAVTERFAKRRNYFAQWLETPLRFGLQQAYGTLGLPVYDRYLKAATERMNRHATTAFEGYQPGAGDVITSAYFKAGTNWVMHICYQITQLGEGEFEHIMDVMPWPDAAQPRFWLNLHDPLPYQSPTGLRAIKSHLAATHIPINAEAKYIAVTRDPKDCAASAYHFFHSVLFGPTMPPPKRWLEHFASANAFFGPWYEFTASWYALREKPNVLFLRFEDMKADPLQTINVIAEFMGVELSEKARKRVAEKTSFSAMQSINHKFYPPAQNSWTNPKGKIIRKGKVGDSKGLFDPDELAHFDEVMERGLLVLDSDFPYQQHYRLN